MPASPTASTSAVTALPAARPAASLASARSMLRPTTPLITSSPCRPGVMPAVQAKPPCTTAGTHAPVGGTAGADPERHAVLPRVDGTGEHTALDVHRDDQRAAAGAPLP